MSALEGMQPQFRQTPPSDSFSTSAVFLPSWASRMAATYPPGPAPITTASKVLVVIRLSWFPWIYRAFAASPAPRRRAPGGSRGTTPPRSCTTTAAATRPKAPVTKATLPWHVGSRRRCPSGRGRVPGMPVLVPGQGRGSPAAPRPTRPPSPRAGRWPRCRGACAGTCGRPWRAGRCGSRERSVTWTAVGSIRRAAPRDGDHRDAQVEAAGDDVELRHHRVHRVDDVGRPGRDQPLGRLRPVGHAGRRRRGPGRDAARAARPATSALNRPNSPSRAWSCRLALVSSTRSPSTRVSRPTPARASASAVKEPTPPSPSTTTWAAPSRSTASSPRRRAFRSERGDGLAVRGHGSGRGQPQEAPRVPGGEPVELGGGGTRGRGPGPPSDQRQVGRLVPRSRGAGAASGRGRRSPASSRSGGDGPGGGDRLAGPLVGDRPGEGEVEPQRGEGRAPARRSPRSCAATPPDGRPSRSSTASMASWARREWSEDRQPEPAGDGEVPAEHRPLPVERGSRADARAVEAALAHRHRAAAGEQPTRGRPGAGRRRPGRARASACGWMPSAAWTPGWPAPSASEPLPAGRAPRPGPPRR